VSIGRLLAGYRDGSSDAGQVVAHAYERARSAAQPAWISLVPWAQVKASLGRLRRADAALLPLYGIPFAVKATSTSRACPRRPRARPTPTRRTRTRSSSSA